MLRDSGNRGELARYMALSQVGLEMVAPAVVGLLLDHYLGWRPWGVIAGAVLGLVGGVAHLVLLAEKANRATGPDSENRQPPREGPSK